MITFKKRWSNKVSQTHFEMQRRYMKAWLMIIISLYIS